MYVGTHDKRQDHLCVIDVELLDAAAHHLTLVEDLARVVDAFRAQQLLRHPALPCTEREAGDTAGG